MTDEKVKVVHRYYITNQEGVITEDTPFYDKIDEKPLWGSLHRVEKNGKKGVVNLKTGEIILEPTFDLIERTRENPTRDELLLKWKDEEGRVWHGFYKIARPTGVITQLSESSYKHEYELVCCMICQFYLTQDYDVWPFGSEDRKGNLLKVRKNGKIGLMNTETCELILDFQFGGPNTIFSIDLESLDEEGYVRVHLNTDLGIANIKTGQIQVKKQYSDISVFNKYGLALVYSSFKGHKTWGMMNREGKEVIPAINSADCITLGRPETSGWGWTKVGRGLYEHTKTIFECEENDFLVGFNLQENMWYLYTKTGLSMPYPLKRLDFLYQNQLTSYKTFPERLEQLSTAHMKYFQLQLEREILQVKGELNTFVFPDMWSYGSWPNSDKKQKITLFKKGIIVETFTKGESACQYREKPEHRDIYSFTGTLNNK